MTNFTDTNLTIAGQTSAVRADKDMQYLIAVRTDAFTRFRGGQRLADVGAIIAARAAGY